MCMNEMSHSVHVHPLVREFTAAKCSPLPRHLSGAKHLKINRCCCDARSFVRSTRRLKNNDDSAEERSNMEFPKI